METILDKKLAQWKHGKLFLISDVAESEDTTAIRQQLARKVRQGIIKRYCCGIYHYPETDTKFGLGQIPATNEDIAKTYARKHNIKLYPTPEAAQNILGISTQNQLNTVYLTNGRSVTLDTGRGNGITLIHTSNNNLQEFRSSVMRMIAIALMGMNNNKLEEAETKVIVKHMQQVNNKDYIHDIKLLKRWQYILSNISAR